MDSLFLHIPGKVHFGRDSRLQLGPAARKIGTRALLIADSILHGSSRLRDVQRLLNRNGVETITFSEVTTETTSKAGEACLDLAKSAHVEMIIGMGGVRTLSLAKAIAAAGSSIFDFDSLITGQGLTKPVYPYIELPTTCRNPFMLGNSFYLTDARNRSSRVFSAEGAAPELVVMDPAFSTEISSQIAAATVLDTLLHSLEGFFSTRTNFMSSTLLLRSIGRLVDFIKEFKRHDSPEVEIKAHQGGLLSAVGLTMGSPGVGTAISICASGLYRVPKSGISAVILPVILEYGREACPEKIARMAPILEEDTRGMRTTEAADRVIGSLRRSIDSLKLPLRLSDYGIKDNDLPVLVSAVSEAGLSDGMPLPLNETGILKLLRDSL